MLYMIIFHLYKILEKENNSKSRSVVTSLKVTSETKSQSGPREPSTVKKISYIMMVVVVI